MQTQYIQGFALKQKDMQNNDKNIIRLPRQEEKLRLEEVNVVVKNSRVVSFEHPLTIAIVQRSESYWISVNSDILFIEENFC